MRLDWNWGCTKQQATGKEEMMLLSQPPISTRKCSVNLKLTSPNSPVSSNSHLESKIIPKTRRYPSSNARALGLTLAKAEGSVDCNSATKQAASPSFTTEEETVFVSQENVPIEGVIQFEKPDYSSRLSKWGRVAMLAGGDVLALLLFSAIGRFNHGFSVFDIDTLRTADPFIAGWFLSAYFLGGYAEDGRGMNGLSKAVIAAAKSWAVGIPLSSFVLSMCTLGVITHAGRFLQLGGDMLGLIIRAITSGHIPPYSFLLVTMGSTCVLLIGWRALLFSILPNDKSKKNDMYRRGNPFELFELLTSLVRRW